MPRGRRPPPFVHDYGPRLLPGAPESVEVLMMMERIAARPIDHLNVGIGVSATIELITLPGSEQHIGDSRHRNHRARRCERQSELGPGNFNPWHADTVGGAVSEGKPGSRQPDAA